MVNRQDRWIQTELAFTLAKNATKLNPFEIISLQTTRKENKWKTEETLERAVVTLETERIKGSNPWRWWWWWWWWWCMCTAPDCWSNCTAWCICGNILLCLSHPFFWFQVWIGQLHTQRMIWKSWRDLPNSEDKLNSLKLCWDTVHLWHWRQMVSNSLQGTLHQKVNWQMITQCLNKMCS
jgi:hypothetical protein